MDLLKEEEKLIEKKQKALANLERKRKYFFTAQASFRKARRELKAANIRLRAIRKEMKYAGYERPVVPPASDPVVIHTPSVEPTSVEENTD